MVANTEQIKKINSLAAAKNFQHRGESFSDQEKTIFDQGLLTNRTTGEPELDQLRATVEFLANFKEAKKVVSTENPGLSENGKQLLNYLFQERRTNSFAYELVRNFFGQSGDD